MRVKRLELFGFKSFASKTTVHFERGVTAIVGPNGSGKCVHGSSRVVLADGRVLSIGELVEAALAQATEVERWDDGYCTYQNPQRLQVLSVNLESFKIESRPIAAFVKRTAPASLIRLVTKTGRELVATNYHPLFTLEAGSLTPLPADQLKPGMRIAIPRRLPAVNTADQLDQAAIFEAFERSDSVYVPYSPALEQWVDGLSERHGGLAAMSRAAGVERVHVRMVREGQALNLATISRLQAYATDEDGWRVTTLQASRGAKAAITVPTQMSPALARFLGYCISEGRNTSANQIWFVNSDPALVEDFCRCATEVFSVMPRVLSYKPTSKDVIVFSHALSEYLEKAFQLGVDQPSAEKRVPDSIFSSSNACVTAFLSALFEGDGYLCVKRSSRTQRTTAYVEYSTASRHLADGVCLLLARFGIVGRIVTKFKAATNTRLKTKRRYFSVMIYGVEQLKRLASVLEFRGQKRQALERLRKLEQLPNPNDDVVPGATSLVRELVRKAGISVKRIRAHYPTLAAYVEQRCEATRPGIQRVLKAVEQFGVQNPEVRNASHQLDLLATSDLFWDEIVRVESIPGEEWVYDLAVERDHNFIANGMVVHNSNLVDAIRWVLGEHNPRDVRAPRLEDVIFNGTDTHAPLSMADVTLTIDNEQALIPIAFSEVQITRRVYRSGESECFLNQSPCRLRDLQELFLGTGLGGGAYAIIEQGHIDMILSSKPEERRAVFEEASGISRYLTKKQETMRKLDEVEQDLVRVADIIQEVRRQVGALERQAARARQYKTQWEQLKGWELRLAVDELKQGQDTHERLSRSVEELTRKRQALDAERQRLLSALEARNSAVSARQAALQQVRTRVVETASRIDQQTSQLSLKSGWVEELTQQRRQLDVDEHQVQGRIQQLTEQLTALTEQQAALEQQAKDLRTQRAALEQDLARIASEQAEGAKTLEQGKVDLFAAASESSQQRNTLADVVLRLQTVGVQAGRTQEQRAALEQRLGALAQRRKQLEDECRVLSDQQDTLQRQLSGAAHAAAQANDQRHALMGRLSRAREQLLSRRATVQMLEHMWKRYEGFPEAVKAVIANPPDGVLGLLADLLEPKPGYEQAVEAALGPLSTAIVVRDRQALQRCQQFVTSQQLDGAHVVVLSDAGQSLAPTPRQTPDGFLGWLPDYVRHDPLYRPVVQRLLGGWGVVEGLTRLMQTGGPGGEGAWVSKQGDRWDGRSWQFVGGGSGSHGRLGRKQRWEQAAQQLAALEREAAELQQALQQAEARWQSLASDEERLRRQTDQVIPSVTKLDGQLTQLAHETKRAQEELTAAQQDHEEFLRQQQELSASGEQARQHVAEAEARQQALEQAMKAVQAQLEEHHQRTQQHRVSAAQHEAAGQAVADRQQEARARLADVESQQRELSGQRDRKRAQTHELSAKLAELTRQIEEHRAQIPSLTESQTTLQHEADRIAAVLHEEETQRDQVMPSLLAVEQDLMTLTQTLKEQESRLTERSFRRTRILERLQEVYRIDGSQVLAEQSSAAPMTEEERQSLTAQVDRLKAKLESMGPVSLGSVEEYDQLKQRLEFLQTQQQDLLKAQEDLRHSIQQINRTARSQFRETFAKIQQEFQHYFTRLFNGGQADLILVDEDDVLESGIEIMARPPGKRPQSISLLSGGERALTATALLFALFKVRPSPFCILDEIDAPLDEANVDRFTKVLEEFLNLSQFILITHNKKTITKADCMYGVTMEQPGMSKIVSVKLTRSNSSPAPAPPAEVPAAA